MKKKSMLLVLMFVFSFLVSAAFAEATYDYTTKWFYNGAPVNGVRGINYICNDSGCNSFSGPATFDQTSATNSITIPYATPATANGYGTYWAAPCYVYYEMWWAPMSGGSFTQNMQFTKKSGCSAPILSVQLPPTLNIGTAAAITVRVNSPLNEISAIPYGEPNDTSFVQNFLSASTSVRIDIRNSTNDVVYTNTVTDYILQDTASTIVFTWTPTKAGTYSLNAVTNVPDCKCSSSQQQIQTINNINVMASGGNLPPVVNVLSPSPGQQFALCEIINFNVNATDPDGTIQNIVWSINGQVGYVGNNFPVAASVFGIGQHPGTVTVTDNAGGITSVNFNFSVLSHPNPIVMITQPVFNPAPATIYNYGIGTTITFNALATATDICNPPSGFQYIWRDNGVNIISNQQSFSLDNLTLGIHNMTVYVTDGIGGVAADNMIINITQTPNVCPTVQITSPLNGNTFANPCQQIDFASSVTDSDGTINSVSWIYSSSIISTNYNFTSNASYFGVGNRVVTLSAVDNSGCQRNASVNFDVLAHLNPVCLITLPINNPNPSIYYAYPMNVPIPFSAMATAQDACAPSSYSWIWRDNNIPIVTNNNNFTVSNLSIGPHNMTVYASDGYGGQCYDTILVNITNTNTPPVANIITPIDNQQFVRQCEMISFTSQVFDTNIGGSIQSIQWVWNGNILSTQENFTINASTFNLGNNTVTLTAVDNDGIPTIDSVTFNIASHSQPAVMITSPPNGSLYTQGTMINFNAQAFPTDVCVPVFSWIWRDNNIPWVSGQQSFSLNNLTAGLHDITAYAYDQYGQSNYSRVFINITTIPNIAPIIAGIRCVNNSGGPLIKEWDPIICNATAYDTNGMITSWLWSINGSGVSIGPNASNDIFTLPGGLNDGNYTVRLTVLDNGTPVLSATSSIPLMILPNIPPVVMINSPAVDPYWNMEFCPINFNASASDADGYILQPWDEIYTWNVAMANGTSQFISDSQGFSYVNRLPAGFNTFTVSVTDDDGATASDSVAINTTKNVPPTVQILLPVSVPTYNISEGNNITFDASVTAGNSDDCSGCTLNDYAWAWFDTYNGVTTQISSQKGFTLLNPGIGIHTITVSSTDCYMASNIDTITVNVTDVPNQNPVVTIWRPLATGVNYYIDHCENVDFNATAIDPDGDNINAWMWNFETLAGMQMRTVPLFTVPAINFSIGNHTAYAYAFDNQTPPGVGSASVMYEVREHTNPIASILAPANGTQWLVGLPLTFIGNAVSTDRCNANTFSWIWTEDGNIMSTQPTFSISTLALGWHKVTLFATDQYGHSNSTSRYINITQNVNVPPVINSITCVNMSNSTPIREFENFYCYASATDFDGIINTWIWDIEGDGVGPQFGTSTFMAPVTLINGTYNVTLIVVDNGTTTPPLSTSLTVPLIIVNNPPVVTVTPLLQSGNEPYTATFTCSVAGGNMPFSYSFDFGNGVTNIVPSGNATSVIFNITYFQNGTYNVMCNVTDMDGDRGFAGATATVGDSAPFANFTFTPSTPYENDTVTFTDFSRWTNDPITSWFWNFGDGTNLTTLTSTNPTHRYVNNSIYIITLTVTDFDGTANSTSKPITVMDTAPQIILLNGPNSIPEGTSATFTGVATGYDVPLTYNWNFGDGNTTSGIDLISYSNYYVQNGTYTVILTVTDSDFSSVSANRTINVTDTAPTAVATTNLTGMTAVEGDDVFFNASLSTGYDKPLTYMWYFGDGTSLSGAEVVHQYPITNSILPILYTVTLVARDADGTTNNDTLSIIVLDSVPQAYAGIGQVVDEGVQVNLSAVGTIPSLDMPNTYTWFFGDGTQSATTTTQTASHTYQDDNTYVVTLLVNDTDGSYDNSTTTIIVQDIVPNADFIIVPSSPNEGGIITFTPMILSPGSPSDPIANYTWNFGDGSPTQTDVNAIPKQHSYTDNEVYNVTLTVSDEDSPITISKLVTIGNVPPSPSIGGPFMCDNNSLIPYSLSGFATDNGTNDTAYLMFEWDFNYTGVFASPADATGSTALYLCPAVTGNYTIALRVTDDDLGSAIVTTSMNSTSSPGNTAPFVQIIPPPNNGDAFVAGTRINFTGLANDFEDGPLTGNNLIWSSNIDLFLGNGNQLNISTLSQGIHIITLTANDSAGLQGFDQIVIQITPQLMPPIASIIANPNPVNEGQITIFDFTSSDPDGTVSFYVWNFGDGASNNSLTMPTINSVPHIYNDNGTYNVSLTVVDNDGLSNTTRYIVNANNVPPTLQNLPVPPVTFQEDTSGTIDLTPYATDVSGDLPLTWTSLGGSNIFVTIAGGMANFTATPNWNGTETITVTANDGDGNSVSTTVQITVTPVNDAPVITTTCSSAATEDSAYSCNVDATDADGDSLNYSLNINPAGMAINSSTGMISWTPDNSQVGVKNVEVLVDDGNGGIDTQPFTIIVANNPVSITPIPNQTVMENILYNYNVQSDDEGQGSTSYSLLTPPSGMSINPATGVITWTPTSAQIGPNNVNVQVDDGNGGIDTQPFTITVTAIPVYGASLSYAGNLSTTPGVSVTYNITITNIGNVADTYTIYYTNMDFADSFAFTNLSASLNASQAGTFRLTTGDMSTGVFRANVTATSNTDPSATSTLIITTTVNSGDITPPVISNIQPVNGSTVAAIPFTLSANTNENANCKYSTISTFDYTTQGTVFTTTGGLTHSENLTLLNGTYIYYIKCQDAAGNTNNNTNQGTTSFTVDTSISDITPPAINLISPVNGATWTTSSNVLFEYNVNDAIGTVPSCELIINGASVATDNTITEGITQNFNYILVNGAYTWGINCTDSSSNEGTSVIYGLTVNVGGPNTPPLANAGIDQSVLINTLVTLNGAGSTDDGQLAPLTYSWTQISGPGVVLIGSNTAAPTFTPTTSGAYTFNLTVYDGQYYSSDSVNVVVFPASSAIVTSGLVFFDSSFNPITIIGAGNNMYVALTIDNILNSTLVSVPSVLTAAGFTIIGASDSPPPFTLDNTIISNIAGVPTVPSSVTIWWYVTAPGASTPTITVNTAGLVDSRNITVI